MSALSTTENVNKTSEGNSNNTFGKSKTENKHPNRDIDVLYRAAVKCTGCSNQAQYKLVKVSGNIFPVPKLEASVQCHNCGLHNVYEYDEVISVFKLLVKCTFKSKVDLGRRIYLNGGSIVVIKTLEGSDIKGNEDNTEFSFSEEDALIDTVETLLQRAMDKLSSLTHSEVNDTTLDYVDTCKILEEMQKTGELIIEINDPSGMSRVLHVGVLDVRGKLGKDPENEPGVVEYKKT